MTTTSTVATPAVSTGRGLANSLPHLFVHTRLDKLDLASPICASEDFGAVVCVPPNVGHTNLSAVVRRFTDAGGNPAGLLFDANRYAGKRRAIGADAMTASWVRTQTNAGVTHPITDSGYIPAGDHASLRRVLRLANDMGSDVIAALPIANQYLNRDVDVLIDEINAVDLTAVALMVEHRGDPFSVRGTVRGLIRLLAEANRPVLLLRSDLSVIGALAWGARAGAFGTSTTLRHIYPITSGGGGRPASVSAAVLDTMSLVRLAKIEDAIEAFPDPMWNCPCAVCYGRALNWIATEDQAFQHSLAVVSYLANDVLDKNLNPLQRRQVWQSRCHNAQFRTEEIDAETKGAGWKPADFLGAWVAQPIEHPASV